MLTLLPYSLLRSGQAKAMPVPLSKDKLITVTKLEKRRTSVEVGGGWEML